MGTHLRGLAAAAAGLSLLIMGVGPAVAAPAGDDHGQRLAAGQAGLIATSPPPCEDRGYRLLGARWNSPYRWAFNAASTPDRLDTATVRTVLKRSFANVTGARNDCGRADMISATSEFLGATGRRVNCRAPDGHNVIGFAPLPFGVLAVTCYWKRDGRMVEADMKISRGELWALRMRGCRFQPVLEAVITHEAGHVFGLDHIGEQKHGRLTMSPYLDGPCQNGESTLGLGDMLALEALY